MSDGQWRVLVLLIVLLGLEILRSGPVHSFFQGLFSNVNISLPGSSTGSKPTPPGVYGGPPGGKGSKPQ